MAYLKKLFSFNISFLNFGVPYRKKGMYPLLTTKYEPDMVKTHRDIEAGE